MPHADPRRAPAPKTARTSLATAVRRLGAGTTIAALLAGPAAAVSNVPLPVPHPNRAVGTAGGAPAATGGPLVINPPAMDPGALDSASIAPADSGAATPGAVDPGAVGAIDPAPADTGLFPATAYAAPQASESIPTMPTSTAPGNLPAALTAAVRGEGRAAYAMRNGMSNALDRHIVEWVLIRTDNPVMTSSAIVAFGREAPDFLSPMTIRARAESALLRENPPARQVLALFGSTPPSSVDGARIYARAQLAVGDRSAASGTIRRVFVSEMMTDAQQDAILDEFKALISGGDIRVRLELLLYNERIRQAERLEAYLTPGERAYVDARIAVIRKAPDAARKMAAVPSDLKKLAGYKFIEAQTLRRAGKDREAAAVLLSVPADARVMVEPDAWWIERRLVSRELLDMGDPATAYKLAASHAATGDQERMDAEFHAGWYALRFLKDPGRAMTHFKRLDQIAKTPISRARAEYWMGRAAEAQGGNASGYYREAAAYGMTYYGQLARAKLGQASAGVGGVPAPSGADKAAFERNEAVRAIRRLIAIGEIDRTWPLFDHLSETLPTPGQVVLLAQLAEKNGKYHFALMVAKEAQNRGIPVGGLAFPTAGIPRSTRMPTGIERPLVYAIARQESTFNPGAVSSAGAKGLMQMMPATAQATARKAGVPFSASRLTDPVYNASLGAYHLDELVSNFNGSYVLTFVAYNAGPGRAKEWISRYGDPRDPSVDSVDWVERIPFSETRNYVMRVMENVQVYREQLGTGRLAIDRDLKRAPSG